MPRWRGPRPAPAKARSSSAREQTNARTRRGNAWIGYAGNLHCALIIEPDYPNEESWQLAYVNVLAVGSAIAEMVSPMTGLRFAWPNRLLINDLLAARLDIAATDPARDPYRALVLGASVNVAQHPPQTEPEEYNSIHASGARDITVVDVLEAYASHFLSWSSRWAEEGFGPIRRAWRIRADGLGTDAEIRLLDESIEGRVDDVDERGRARPRHRPRHAPRHDRGVLRPGLGPRGVTVHSGCAIRVRSRPYGFPPARE